jgi:hypothetical protein
MGHTAVEHKRFILGETFFNDYVNYIAPKKAFDPIMVHET